MFGGAWPEGRIINLRSVETLIIQTPDLKYQESWNPNYIDENHKRFEEFNGR